MTRPFWTDGTVTIRHGNALALPQPDASVDLVVTSPPFFGLRSYTDGGEHYDGQIGSEATPGEFLDALAAATPRWLGCSSPPARSSSTSGTSTHRTRNDPAMASQERSTGASRSATQPRQSQPLAGPTASPPSP
jgi:hypothetical protein